MTENVFQRFLVKKIQNTKQILWNTTYNIFSQDYGLWRMEQQHQ